MSVLCATSQPLCDEALSAQIKIMGGNVGNNHDLN
jgi:hypothetical protein